MNARVPRWVSRVQRKTTVEATCGMWSPPNFVSLHYRERKRIFSKESRCSIDVNTSNIIIIFSSLGPRTLLSQWKYMPVLVLSLVDNATLAGKRSMLYISGYTGLSYIRCVVQWRLSSRSIQVYTHICTTRRERSSVSLEVSRNIESRALPLKRSITGREERKKDQWRSKKRHAFAQTGRCYWFSRFGREGIDSCRDKTHVATATPTAYRQSRIRKLNFQINFGGNLQGAWREENEFPRAVPTFRSLFLNNILHLIPIRLSIRGILKDITGIFGE